jgi:DNA-binding HxlR family transcriptional regulator
VLGEGVQAADRTADVAHPRVHRAWSPLARALAATGDRWTLLLIVALAPGRTRLNDLHRRLPGVSTGVLERYVQQMVALDLVRRTRFREMPPRVELELTDAGRELLPIAGALARWGMRHVWSPPRESERVDVGALLRLLPFLFEEHADLPDGALEAVVADACPPIRLRYRVREGRLLGDDHTDDVAVPADGTATPQNNGGAPHSEPAPCGARAAATMHGDGVAWIAAFSPPGDYARLDIGGDRRLVSHILDALPRSA